MMSLIWKSIISVKQSDILGHGINSITRSNLLNHLNVSQILSRSFSVLTSKTILPLNQQPADASPASSNIFGTTSIPVRGMKIKARVYHRCRDCYFHYSKGILYNLCRAQGRHKQMLKPKYWVNQRIITAVCQTPRKPW